MVVRYGVPSFFYEIPSVTQVVGCVPYFPVDAFGKFFGITFVKEGGVFGPHHVKKNTKTCVISLHMRILGPILRTKSPLLLLMCALIRLVRAVVFGIHQYDINAQFRLLLVKLAGNFEQYAYAACTVVGAEDGCVPVLFIGVGICPGAAVPVREKQDAFFVSGL